MRATMHHNGVRELASLPTIIMTSLNFLMYNIFNFFINLFSLTTMVMGPTSMTTLTVTTIMEQRMGGKLMMVTATTR
jgi:hypothetical protein